MGGSVNGKVGMTASPQAAPEVAQGRVDAAPGYEGWEPWRLAELERDRFSGRVGMELVSVSDRVRVWSIDLPPGGRLPFHRHVLDYFWTCLSYGRARHHYGDGTILEVGHHPGETKHFKFASGEHFVHDVENIGDCNLVFTTVEFLDSENEPLPLP